MSQELETLVKKVARAICCGDAACFYESSGCACLVKENSGFQARALAAIRAVAEATRKPNEAMLEAAWEYRTANGVHGWCAMHGASALGEALHDDAE